MKKLLSFLAASLRGNNDTSHKRLIAVASFVVLSVLAFFSCFGKNCSPEFIYVFAALAGWQSYLTTKENK